MNENLEQPHALPHVQSTTDGTAGPAPVPLHPLVRKFLEQRGWRNSTSLHREIWWKRFDAPRCKCNDDKDGIQVVVTFHDFEGHESYEVDVTGEKQDGVWVRLSAYGIQHDVCQILDSQVAQLVAAWSLIANAPREGRAVARTLDADVRQGCDT